MKLTPVEIPVNLRIPGLRFVLVRRGQKNPFEKDWQTTANYAWDDPKLQAHLKIGGNYGITGGIKIETDTPQLERYVLDNFPPTFTQLSPGHRSNHYIYIGSLSGDIPLVDKTLPKTKQNIGHVKGTGIIIGPGSLHPNGSVYEIVEDRPLTLISKEEVFQKLAPFMAAQAERAPTAKMRTADSLDILSVVNVNSLRKVGREYFGSHPIHGSTTGSNFHVSPEKNVWHCFRCGSGGDAWYWLAVSERVIDCDDAKPRGLRGETFKKTKQIALDRGLVKKPPPPRFDGEAVDSGLTEETDHSQVADGILERFQIRTMLDTDEVYHYNDGLYHSGTEAFVSGIVDKSFRDAELGHRANNSFRKEVLGHVRSRTYTSRDSFDQDPFILNLQNGLLDLRSFELKPHTSNYPSLVQLPVKYDKAADCPRIKKFLSEVNYPEDSATVQEIVGVTLWRDVVQKAFLLIGEGANGKTTFLNLLKSLLGHENISAASLQELETDRFAKADFYGKLANLYADLPDVALKSTGTFKMVTGGDPITAQRKFQQRFKFTSYAKQIHSCNKAPEVYDDTTAFFRRWLLISFPNRFLGEQDNRNLIHELTTNEELSGFLNWALEGLKRLQANKWEFSNSKSVEEIKKDYTRKSSPVRAFLMDACILEAGFKESKQDVYRNFVEYCTLNHLPTVTDQVFFKQMRQHAPNVTTAQHTIEGRKGIWCFEGLGLQPVERWGKQSEEKDEGQEKL